MQSIETARLDALDKAFGDILEKAPQMRRKFHEEMSELIKSDVESAISTSGVNDSSGMVRRWQVAHVGSGGGYAAVRSAGSSEGAETGANSPGAVTNYLESGHNIRSASGGKGYRPRIRVAYVNGYHFYETALSQVEGQAIKKAEEWVDKIAKELGG